MSAQTGRRRQFFVRAARMCVARAEAESGARSAHLEAADRQAEALVSAHAPVHAVDEPRRRVRVDLLSLGRRRRHRARAV